MLIDRPHRAAFGMFARAAPEALLGNTQHRENPANDRHSLVSGQYVGGKAARATSHTARHYDSRSASTAGQGRATPPKLRPLARASGRPLMVAIALLGLSMAAIGLRVPLVRAIPGSSVIFSSIGLPVNLRGLELRHVTSRLMGQDGSGLLAIEGEIVNTVPVSVAVPVLELSVRDATGVEIYSWTTQPPKASLAIGETMPFRARLASPPARAHDVIVRFAPEGASSKETRQ